MKLTPYEIEVMSEYYNSEEIRITEEIRWNERLLSAIADLKGDEFKENVKTCITADCNVFGKWELVNEPQGDYQTGDEYGVKLWVDQYGPGISGDDYNGWLYILIKPGKWLKVEYSC